MHCSVLIRSSTEHIATLAVIGSFVLVNVHYGLFW